MFLPLFQALVDGGKLQVVHAVDCAVERLHQVTENHTLRREELSERGQHTVLVLSTITEL